MNTTILLFPDTPVITNTVGGLVTRDIWILSIIGFLYFLYVLYFICLVYMHKQGTLRKKDVKNLKDVSVFLLFFSLAGLVTLLLNSSQWSF